MQYQILLYYTAVDKFMRKRNKSHTSSAGGAVLIHFRSLDLSSQSLAKSPFFIMGIIFQWKMLLFWLSPSLPHSKWSLSVQSWGWCPGEGDYYSVSHKVLEEVIAKQRTIWFLRISSTGRRENNCKLYFLILLANYMSTICWKIFLKEKPLRRMLSGQVYFQD